MDKGSLGVCLGIAVTVALLLADRKLGKMGRMFPWELFHVLCNS